MIPSYPSIYNLGHRVLEHLFDTPVVVEEKVDGSQLSFAKDNEGQIHIRSKGAVINTLAPEKMFSKAVDYILSIQEQLPAGYIFRGEYLSSKKHNCLDYSRIPNNHIVVFDVQKYSVGEYYLPRAEKEQMVAAIGLELIPLLYTGEVKDITAFRELLAKESFLGGVPIEGVVIKPAEYNVFGRDKKLLMGKFVSEAFREIHEKTWTAEHATPRQNEIVDILASRYASSARWAKAVQHGKELGVLDNSPKDIGWLMKEVPEDVAKECKEDIMEQLYAWAWPMLRRRLAAGLPEWYKEQLLKDQFVETTPALAEENKV